MAEARRPETSARRRPAPRAGLAALAAAATLAACGSGGGTADPQPAPVFASGTVAKGPVAGARVCASWLSGGVADASTTTCTRSADDGGWRLELPRRAGLLLVEADGGTWADEAVPGARVTLGRLRAIAPFDGVALDLAVHVTALTELAARRALARGAPDAATVAAAAAEVGRTFGVTGLPGTRAADVTLPQAATQAAPELFHGLANAGVRGWMAERGRPADALDAAIGELSARMDAGTLYEEQAAFRAGMRRVIVANPASGLAANASAYAAMVPLDFGAPPPQPQRPPIVERPGTQRVAVRWPVDDLFQRPSPAVCATNVPAGVPLDTVRAAVAAHAATYGTTVSSVAPVARCLGGGQSITIDWSATTADPWGTAVWGDEG